MEHELGSDLLEHRCDLSRAGVGEPIQRKEGRRLVFGLIDMRIGNDGEANQPAPRGALVTPLLGNTGSHSDSLPKRD
jgi:hypothetical protein